MAGGDRGLTGAFATTAMVSLARAFDPAVVHNISIIHAAVLTVSARREVGSAVGRPSPPRPPPERVQIR